MTALATGALVLLALNFTAGEKKVQQQLPRLYSTASPQFERALGSLLGPGIVGGNQVTELLNGDQIFPPMLAAIKAAQKSVTFETYIYWSGDIGKAFADALSERARAGVPVHVLLDWVGSSKMEESYLTEMREAGVQIEKFHKPHWYNLARMNNRTHRKLLVVDGQVGFHGRRGHCPPLDGQRPRPTTGATRTTWCAAPWWRRCRPPFWTTGSRSPARCCTARRTFPPLHRRARKGHRCFPARHRVAARACS